MRYYLCFVLCLLILLIHESASTTSPDLTIPLSCPKDCGGLAIPYPFGIGKGCFLNDWYEILCTNSTSQKHIPVLSRINMEVSDINPFSEDSGDSYGTISVKSPMTSMGCTSGREESGPLLNVTGSPFFLDRGNSLVAVGCNIKAVLTDAEPQIAGCISACDGRFDQLEELNTICSGYNCCQTSLPTTSRQLIGVRIESIDANTTTRECGVAFLTNQTYSPLNISEVEQFHVSGYSVVDLGWYFDTTDHPFANPQGCMDATGLGYPETEKSCLCYYGHLSRLSYANCRCRWGYSGNPYLPGGCQDIDECTEYPQDFCGPHRNCMNKVGDYACAPDKTWAIGVGLGSGFGLLILVGGIYWLCKFIKKRKRINRRRKFFKRNGGLLLQQQLHTTEGNVEKSKIFSSEELEKATENFSSNRVLGQGGQGTVYKGMLMDGRIVAVKRSQVVDEDKLEEFINEVVVLSQINHRNIVKLLGCCLETEVPILVYEFIPNGNLFEHLQGQFEDYNMTWEVLLRIAAEIAGAVSYLHSAASSPVYHRDIKSTNVLLDEKCRAKVSDFGMSRSVTIDDTHLTTVVAGTVGYMDPEYLQTGQFADKSDVYSFGVVLVELITGEKSDKYESLHPPILYPYARKKKNQQG